MIVCLDTNVLVQARARSHPYHCILRSCAMGSMSWAVSNAILTEYQEVITRLGGVAAWGNTWRLIEAIHQSGNLILAFPQFRFNVIKDDPDDNAFIDCAITAQADYVITEDHHFAPLADAGYKPQPIKPVEFIGKYRGVYV